MRNIEGNLEEKREKPVLGIIIPCYNEEEVIEISNKVLQNLLRRMIDDGLISAKSFMLYVDDGSSDRTWSIISGLNETYQNVAGLKLSKNEGQQPALIAGMEMVKDRCDAMVTMDVDLQDEPEAVIDMVKDYRDGAEVVYGVRDSRGKDTWFKRETALGFYKIMQKLGTNTIYNHSEFRLMSRRVVEALLSFPERNLYLRGLIPMIGYKQTIVKYARTERAAGVTKYSIFKLINLAINAITSLSVRPVRMLFVISLLFLLVALGILIYVLINHFNHRAIEGWASMMLSIWFCSGVVLLGLGIVGEYVGKIYTEVKQRPIYFTDTFLPPSGHKED